MANGGPYQISCGPVLRDGEQVGRLLAGRMDLPRITVEDGDLIQVGTNGGYSRYSKKYDGDLLIDRDGVTHCFDNISKVLPTWPLDDEAGSD